MEKCSKKVICNLEIIVLNEKIWKVCWMIWGVKKSQWRPGKRGKILVWLNCKGQKLTVNKLIATHTFFMCFFLYMFLSLLCVLLAFFPVNLPLPCLAVPCHALPSLPSLSKPPSLQVTCPYPTPGVGALSDREAKDTEAKAKSDREREKVWERAGNRRRIYIYIFFYYYYFFLKEV